MSIDRVENESEVSSPAKKEWVAPTLDVQPAALAEQQNSGSNDGTSCHS